MKLHIAPLILLCLCMAAVPAMADTYSNGPANGNVDAWTINFGFSVTDSFTFAAGGGTVNSLSFAAWVIPGDTITNVEVSIGTTAFANNLYDAFVNLTQSNCVGNSYGYNVCTETALGFSGPNLGNGTYWLTLQNANVPSGDPVYWDENSGPSQAQENTIGTIPSEAFTIGNATTTTCDPHSCSCFSNPAGVCPEPGSLLLFGSGIVGMIGLLRLKMPW